MAGVGDVDDTFASAPPSSASPADIVGSLYDLHQRELFTFALAPDATTGPPRT